MSQELIPVNQSISIGQIANQYAARNAFNEYQTRIAKNTRLRQKDDIALFTTFLNEAGMQTGDLMNDPTAWSDITYGLIKTFVQWQLSQGFSIGSINVRLSTVKTYCKLATESGSISPSEHALIRLVTGYRHAQGKNVDQDRKENSLKTRQDNAKKATPVSITPEQAKRLKAQPDTAQGKRDALLMCLLLDHGLRCGEVAALTADSINVEEGTLRFYRQKVNKTQTHQLTNDTYRAAMRYFQVCTPTNKLLMGSRKGGKLEGEMKERSITDRVNTLGEEIGIKGLSAHDCRHYFATDALRNGTDIKSLQQAGGWNSIAMPMRYVEDAEIANKGVKLS